MQWYSWRRGYLQCLPVEADVQVMFQVCQQRFADDDVIRAGVVVQLLVPVLWQPYHTQLVHLCACTLGGTYVVRFWVGVLFSLSGTGYSVHL